ncbi:DNA polymerase III subunit beta [Geomesophilobacter sediminis]|uniref:Beta sliding clamp n=1 Tax=Geomesophilobacter sediminis TaxID=2798584 RepID=A0A8J7ISD5_9BACT|nr:DNA polymerase III subunit beta [Geomesophilobacter sediminis]MBJ6726184.1 DNA polymerase III subunit beta [Geomesophilobacter sediminis]
MEFKISKEIFLKALQRIQGIVEKRNTMPILSNALLEVGNEQLFVTATDLEVGMKSSYPTQVIREGKITVSAKKLYEIVKEMPDEEIHFSTKENDWVEIVCGKARFNIVGLSSDEFPYFPKVKEENFILFKNEILAEMIEKTSYAICYDETKYNLNGIFIKGIDEGEETLLRMVATDGHRLSVSEKRIEGKVGPELAKGVIFPKKGIFELKKMTEEEAGEIMLGFMDNSAVIKKGNTVVVMRLIDGEFPDYTKVIPAQNNCNVLIGRDKFLHSLKRMAILSSEKFKGIKIDLNPQLVIISSSNPELGEAREEIEAQYEGNGISARFNAKYLIDVLSVMEEREVELKLKDELSPVIMKAAAEDDFMAVIMPMRL